LPLLDPTLTQASFVASPAERTMRMAARPTLSLTLYVALWNWTVDVGVGGGGAGFPAEALGATTAMPMSVPTAAIPASPLLMLPPRGGPEGTPEREQASPASRPAHHSSGAA